MEVSVQNGPGPAPIHEGIVVDIGFLINSVKNLVVIFGWVKDYCRARCRDIVIIGLRRGRCARGDFERP